MPIVHKKLFLFLFVCLFFSCTRDLVMEVSCDEDNYPVYEGEIRTLINTTCAYSGCHDGITRDSYQNFDALQGQLNDEFIRRVNIKSMPPQYAEGRKELTDTEILLLQCWAQGGYLEN